MSGPKHTPSVTDWEYNAAGGLIEGRAPGYGSVTIAEIRGYGYLTGQGPGALGLPQEYAEAIQDGWGRKMAAAPRLVEALKRVKEWNAEMHRANDPSLVPCLTSDLYNDWRELMTEVRAALREAEGS